MDELEDRSFARYIAAVRRQWRVVVGVAIIGAVFGVVLSAGGRSLVTAQVLVAENNAPLVAADLPSDLIGKVISLRAAADAVRKHDVRKELERAAGGDAKSVVTFGDATRTLSIEVTAENDAAANKVADALIDRYRSDYVAQVTTATATVGDSLVQQAKSISTRLDQIDAQASSGAVSETQRVEQATLLDSLLTVEAKQTAMKAYTEGAGAGVLTVSRTLGATAAGRVTKGILGLVVGAMLAAVALAVRGAFDRTVRTQSDLEGLGIPSALAVISGSGDESTTTGLAVALSHHLTKADATVQLVPVDSSVDAVRLAGAVAAAAKRTGSNLTMSSTEPLSKSSQALETAADNDGNILVVRWGSTRIEDVARAVHAFTAAGAPGLAVVISNVPAGEVRNAYA